MVNLMWSSRSAMIAQQEKLDTISNNLANVNTNGYKKLSVGFQDLVYDSMDRKGYPISQDNKANLQNGTGVKASSWKRDNSQGNLNETGKDTDLALDDDGNGYFEVTRFDNSKAYTRAGQFSIDSLGNLVSSNGDRVTIIDNKGNEINTAQKPLKLKSGDFNIEKDGSIHAKNGNSSNIIGKIKVSNVIGDDSMVSVGDSLYAPKQGVRMTPAKGYDVLQGFQELSNVDMAREMTDMLVTQRAFQLNSSSMKTADEMWGMANNLRK